MLSAFLNSVYIMRMARVNVYLPDDLAAEVKRAELNVSRITQQAVRAELRATDVSRWLDRVRTLPSTGASHARAIEALRSARDDFDG